MNKSHLHWHAKSCADEASDDDDDSCSDDDYSFSDMSISSSFSFDSNEKHILEDVYDEIIGTASLFQEETNNNHLDGKHNIGSKANTTLGQKPIGKHNIGSKANSPTPTVAAASLRLTHSIAHDDLAQDNVIFFSVDLEHGGKILDSDSYLLFLVTSQEGSLENSMNMSSLIKSLFSRGVFKRTSIVTFTSQNQGC